MDKSKNNENQQLKEYKRKEGCQSSSYDSARSFQDNVVSRIFQAINANERRDILQNEISKKLKKLKQLVIISKKIRELEK